MDLLTLHAQQGRVVQRYCLNNEEIEIRELEHYRWFHFGDDTIQAMMNTQSSTQVLMPICQAMLLFTLWKNNTLKILNLGMGGATFERFFDNQANIELTSVEQSTQVITMAKTYFSLPEQQYVHCQSAEQFLQQNTQPFDVVLCDLFTQKKNIVGINQPLFYKDIVKNLAKSGVVFINIDPKSEQNLLAILTMASKFFTDIAIIEFENYKNVVLVLSTVPIPSKQTLQQYNQHLNELKTTQETQQKAEQRTNTNHIDFTAYISSMHYLPSKNTQ